MKAKRGSSWLATERPNESPGELGGFPKDLVGVFGEALNCCLEWMARFLDCMWPLCTDCGTHFGLLRNSRWNVWTGPAMFSQTRFKTCSNNKSPYQGYLMAIRVAKCQYFSTPIASEGSHPAAQFWVIQSLLDRDGPQDHLQDYCEKYCGYPLDKVAQILYDWDSDWAAPANMSSDVIWDEFILMSPW